METFLRYPTKKTLGNTDSEESISTARTVLIEDEESDSRPDTGSGRLGLASSVIEVIPEGLEDIGDRERSLNPPSISETRESLVYVPPTSPARMSDPKTAFPPLGSASPGHEHCSNLNSIN